MAVLSVLPKEYGCVIFTGAANIFVTWYFCTKVEKARKEYGVEYPAMYSDEHETFNCIQRAHQNMLESEPSFLFFLMVAGTRYPRATAACGSIWTVSRIFYGLGYSTGDPKKRGRGSFGIPAYLGLAAMSVMTAFGQLGYHGYGRCGRPM